MSAKFNLVSMCPKSKNAVEMAVDTRCKLHALSARLEERSVLAGDNMSVALNATIPSSMLKKKNLACSHHRVREAAATFLDFGHVDTKLNLADICAKPLGGPEFLRLARLCLFRESAASQAKPEQAPLGTSGELCDSTLLHGDMHLQDMTSRGAVKCTDAL